MAELIVEKAERNDVLYDLLEEHMSIIFARLSTKDQVSFRGVCRKWPSYAALKSPPIPPPINQAPYLFSYKCRFYYPKDIQFFYNENDMHVPSGSNIYHSNCGLVLMQMQSCEGDLFFFNPFTKERINLPKVPGENSFIACHFSAAPTREDCAVVGVNCLGGSDATVGVIRKIGQDWEFRFLTKPSSIYLSDSSPVFYRGKYYFFNINNSQWSCSVSTNPIGKDLDQSHREQSYLLEVEGEFFGVFVYGAERNVMVYKLKNKLGMVWEPVENLGGRVFYVSSGLSFGERVAKKSRGNLIYFPKFQGENGVYYSLTTNKYHSVAGDYCNMTSYGLDEFNFGSWFKHNNVSSVSIYQIE